MEKSYVLGGESLGMDVEGLPFVIIRTAEAGVHVGFMVEEHPPVQGGYPVTILDSRRIWEWQGANSLSQLAHDGSQKPEGCRITLPVIKNKIIAIEIIYVTPEAKENLDSIPAWKFKK
jgi:hypothetical protein